MLMFACPKSSLTYKNFFVGFVNTTSLLGEAVTGLPGPSHALRVELLAVLDCDNFQGRVQSAGTTLASAVYTSQSTVVVLQRQNIIWAIF